MKVYYTLNRNFLRMRAITKKTKVNVYKSIFCPILKYGCESWVPTKNIKSKIQAAEMKCLRRIKGITRRDSVRNEVMIQKLKVEPILKKIYKHQLKWFSHLLWMNDSRLVKTVWQARMTGKRKRGHSKKIWNNSTADILREKMLHGWRQIRKCETGKNGQSLCMNKKNNTWHTKG